MSKLDITVEVCGMAGDGTIAAGGLINEGMSRGGLSVLAFDSYPAEIRGFGRCVTRSRIGHERRTALEEHTHVLISLNDEQSLSRVPFLTDLSAVFFDNRPPAPVPEESSLAAHVEPTTALFGMPFSDLAAQAAGSDRGRNLVALGGFAAVFQVPSELFQQAIVKKFKSKGQKVVESNVRCFQAGYAYAQERFSERLRDPISFPPRKEGPDIVMLSGNTAIAEGALDAGLHLYFGYPITPATPIMEYLAKKLPERGGRLMQMEDEIASIGAVLGGFFAGKRSMTATSGPGFALMTELITHGVMSETPAVIVDAQRGGPATGLPTKTEQSDLHAAVFGGPGDSARIVIAPTDVLECYHLTMKSFQLAEKYQIPVIVLTDFFLDNRVESVPPPVAGDGDGKDMTVYPDPDAKEPYRRFKITESGVSPRALPGMEGYIFTATGLEHTEKGLPDYTPENHSKMTEKRYRKLRSALEDLPSPVEQAPVGRMDLGVVGWGSNFGSVHEAVNRACERGLKVGALKLTSIYPYHEDAIRDFMSRCDEVLIAELNFEGQLANLIGHLHRKEVIRLNRVTGLPMPPSVIYKKILEILGETDS
ncbi:MAG: 2-oxoacid:acceptor oxidoreductase subunit alpha [Deltaproteobacteria bacterium]|nr:2-oxoacid:acceptor oxidoreductase subunit alpha [Deltaproteobacteria bacterium]